MESNRSTASLIGIVAGALLVVGSFLSWASASVNLDELASMFGVSVADLGEMGDTSESVSGIDGTDGWITIIAGAIAIGLAVLARKAISKAQVTIMLVAGAIAAILAVWNVFQVSDLKDEILGQLGGTEGGLENLVDVSMGIGLWAVLLGSIGVLVSAFMLRTGAGPQASGMAEPPSPA